MTELQISFRGNKIGMTLDNDATSGTTVGQVKEKLVTIVAARSVEDDAASIITAKEVKLLYRGRILDDDDEEVGIVVTRAGRRSTAVVKLMAMGVSRTEAATVDANATREAFERSKPFVRDDLTDEGIRRGAERRRRGRAVLSKAAARVASPKSGFGRIETLPMLPNETTARTMLEELANDVGIRTCMENRGWTVGCLAELFPEGKVGESPVCVMGLNQNRGQKILLRLRTDDLRGFRKPLSVRKVLYHELAHNEIDDHNDDFFRLMREIERECTELNGARSNNGRRLSANEHGISRRHDVDDWSTTNAFVGGSGRSGGSSRGNATLSKRELALHAADVRRTTAEEDEIEQNCGCGRSEHDVNQSENIGVQSKTLLTDMNGTDEEE